MTGLKMMAQNARVIAGGLFLVGTTNVSATDFLYRVDSRPPEQIFSSGFESHGDNWDLVQHLNGDSCVSGSRDSAYVAMTGGVDETRRIARQYYSSSAFHGTLYRYEIRADENYYRLRVSVDYLISRGVSFTPIQRLMLDMQEEYVAHRVASENIRSAVPLIYDVRTSEVRDGEGLSNPNFLDIESNFNRGVIDRLPEPAPRLRHRVLAFANLISACFATSAVHRPDDLTDRGARFEVPFFDADALFGELI
ncbi:MULTISPECIES: hypothetical protein [unclassified Caballeronia]|uniref:scabin-related ADP-ribosyltransferase n=1 Tax=unclassified Caballeronia TaxID=2646786 RepID=UPI002857C315|nr:MULTISPECIES: hypothetical protein [unclassified Caballeronia]MDR5777688.1 hypothetical protein [Caballeronia sp. LZ002]MDR5805483.1 hypothetical protein [Caballeronia sp. LZ001]MDR5853126.1 hypothetical protein [Caballeronia sp. LZ003]